MDNKSELCNIPNDISEYKLNFGYFLNGPILLVIIIIGLSGNILSLLTLTRPKTPLPQINQYLIALSVWDTVLITSSFFVYNLPHLMDGRIATHGTYVLVYPLCFMLSCASYMCSIWMVMISAVDRYFALCRPLVHRLYIAGGNRTKMILVVCSLVCLTYNAPRYLEMTVGRCLDQEMNVWTVTLTGEGLRTMPAYWICYKIIGGLLFYSAFPFAALTYLSARVSYEVRRLTTSHSIPVRSTLRPSPPVAHSPTPSTLLSQSQSDHEKRVSFNDTVIEYENKSGCTRTSSLRRHSVSKASKSADDHQQALNFMLVAVLLKFLICHSLPTILDVWESSVKQEKFEGPLIDHLVDASNFLVVLNSSVNVFIYAWCSRRFRYDMSKLMKSTLFWRRTSQRSTMNGCKKFENVRFRDSGSNYRHTIPTLRVSAATSSPVSSGSSTWMKYV